MVHLSIVLDNERVVSVDVDGGETVSTLKAILEADTGIPASEQLLSCTGKGLADGATLAGSSVKDGDLLMLARKGGAAEGAPPQSHPMAVDQNGNVVNPQAMLDAIRGNPEIMSQLATGNAPLHGAVRTGDVEKMVQLMREVHAAREAEAASRRQAEVDLWNADPFDPAAQARIAERIQQEHIAHNYEQAYENNPEVFVQVDMLYVNLEINRHTVAAFVDSGAQMTIISLATAERLGLMHLLDKRFGGMAKGVGTGRILGRIHQAMMKVGDEFLATQLTVMENNDMPFLFGLDMLRRHQCQLDLKANVLRFTNLDVALPFLQPHKLPPEVRGTVGAPQTQRQPGDAAGPSQPPASPGPGASAPAGASAAAGAAAAARAAAGAPIPGAAAPAPGSGSAPQPPAAQQPAAPAAAAAGRGSGSVAGGGSEGNEAKLQQLTGLGFSRQQAQEALAVCGGDVDRAASFLFESSMGF